jgi:general secretion pathway protein B
MQRKVSRISELPGTVRKDLPTIIFSGHLYSSNPDSSFVFVDEGRPVRKGQQIANELFLHEITPTGVIVEFRGYLIEVGVLQGWTLH